MLIQLTNDRFEKFYLNTELIETVHQLIGNKSQINLTTGKYVICIESPETLAKMLKELTNGE